MSSLRHRRLELQIDLHLRAEHVGVGLGIHLAGNDADQQSLLIRGGSGEQKRTHCVGAACPRARVPGRLYADPDGRVVGKSY